MELRDNEILVFTPQMLLGAEALYSVYDIEEETERARIIALMSARAKELKLEKEFTNVIKAFNSAEKKLAQEYTKMQAETDGEIPLKLDGKGFPLNTIENFLLILRNDPVFSGLKFNMLTYAPEIEKNGETRRWVDADDSQARRYIEFEHNIHNQSKLDDALTIIFREREYHPVKRIIESVKWDGTERIPKFLIKWLKCEDSDYNREVSRLIFSGGINRLYNPGCKFDDVAILIGTKQGEGKSTFVRWLALNDEFFSEVTEIEGQKGMEALEGAWVCEIAELLALTRTKDQEAVKSYITRQNDRYRRPFDKRVTDHKRQCVFVGTTNKEQFLTDKTGNRRFYPVKVNQSGYDLFDREDELKTEILQCWAEAKVKFEKGKMFPYANRDLVSEIRKHQNSAVEDDYREGLIIDYLKDREEVCILELWKRALDNEFSKPTKKDSNEIALILQATGKWKREEKPKRLYNYGLQKVWVRENKVIDIANEYKDPFGDS
ncbi:MAG: hypothetical protein GX896_05865 [Clostridiales bacterium]|nr:hypothetical protein [Clostridiales bacterium]